MSVDLKKMSNNQIANSLKQLERNIKVYADLAGKVPRSLTQEKDDILKEIRRRIKARNRISYRMEENKRKRLELSRMQCLVESYFNLTEGTFLRKTTARKYTYPRQVCMFIMRDFLNMKYQVIANLLKMMDHTTIIYGANVIREKYEAGDIKVSKDVNEILNALNEDKG